MASLKRMLKLQEVTKVYRMGSVEVHALRGVSFGIEPGEMVAIMGPSGSGKSTLMNIIGCLDVPTSGSYILDDTNISSSTDDKLAEIRNGKIGFVFQSYNLLHRYNALANVELPLVYARTRERRSPAMAALAQVGMSHRSSHRPHELSGGEQQRIAIARALVTNPSLILADEPTGNLDSRTGQEVMGLLQHLNHNQGITVVLVTHDSEMARFTRRILSLRDGLLTSDEVISKPAQLPTPTESSEQS